MSARNRVIDALNARSCRGRGNSWQCPAHEDRSPSLSIGPRNDGNGIVLTCHTGCDTEDVVTALGLTMADLFDEPLAKPEPGMPRRKTAEYPYTDEQGELLFRVERWEPGKNGKKKDFLQRTPDGGYKTKGVRRVLYRLPEVVATAKAGGVVLLCEGEKDADNLAKTGAIATTMPGGVGMGWRDDYTASLQGAAEVVIIADRDEAGITHARKVAASLNRFGVPHRITLPAVNHAKADVSDHIAAGYGFEDLVPLGDDEEEPAEQDETPAPEAEAEQEEPQDRFPRINWYEAYNTDFSQIDWLPGRFMERGQQVALVGPGKAGKSIFVQYWIFCAITGRSFLGDQQRLPLNVLYFDRENNLRDIVTRMIAFGATPEDLQRLDYRLFPRFSGSFDQSAMAAAELLAIVEEQPRDLVIFDTVSRFITGKENDADTWLQFYGRVHAPLKARSISGVRLDHMGKDEDRGARGNSAKSQDVDHVWELTRLTENKTFDPNTGIENITTALKLNRTHTRSGLGEDLFLITRRGQRHRGGLWVPGGTRHELSASPHGGPGAVPGSPEWIVEQLDNAKVPNDWGGRRVIAKCQELGIKSGKTKIEEAVRTRKQRPLSDVPPHVPYSSVTDTSPDENQQEDIFAGQTSPGDPQGTPQDTPQRGASPRPPSKEGGRPPGTPSCTVCNLPLDRTWAARGYDTHVGCDPATGSHPPAHFNNAPHDAA